MCKRLTWTADVASTTVSMVTESLLLIRTLALWHEYKTVKSILIFVYLICCASMIVGLAAPLALGFAYVCNSQLGVTEPDPSIYQITAIGYIGIATFDLVVVLSTIYHGYDSLSSDLPIRGRLVSALRQGNLLYALALLALSSVNAFFYCLPVFVNKGLPGILFLAQCVLHGVMGSRILLELRHVDHSKSGSSSAATDPSSDMEFALKTLRNLSELSSTESLARLPALRLRDYHKFRR
ncbi:hypothetical protein BJ138DRAFT_1141005 [Hygrophoropsis aurantiaca]|uniref:Uncharacterized protein n=1 Tax=Hygrophoropsis aurantiaca TaxID=72124 RepID=A0ACB8ASB9_9AGAM|nr:hypothetical protein BJ138DRAFT_1141005 [Hygrophoropsis aurantiaca]